MSDAANGFIWYELATTDVEAAKAFYGGVMGWGLASISGSNYCLFTAEGTPVAGLISLPEHARRGGMLPQWLGYVEVEDVDAAAAQTRALGGMVRIPPTDVPGVSRFSIVADPKMATLALVRGRERSQSEPAKPGALGHVCWHELQTTDWESAFAFYNSVFGWQKADAVADLTGTYQWFSAGGKAIGGMVNKHETMPFSIWLYYFNVADIDAALCRVKAGGGEVLLGPLAVAGAVRIVHCEDAQGAVFGLADGGVSIAIGCYAPRNPTSAGNR